MKLKVKSLNLVAGRPVAILHAQTAKLLAIYVNERAKIEKLAKKPKVGKAGELIAIVDIAKGVLQEDEIAVSVEIIDKLKLHEGDKVEVFAAPRPLSTNYILEKLNGKELNYKELFAIAADIVNNSLTETEVAYFVSGVYIHGMTLREIASLIKAMVKTGKRLGLQNVEIVDKHSSGGTPGNRTTPIIVSICAAAGLIMPKTSSRAITSAAGTADVMECLTRVEFSIKAIRRIIKKTNACLVWGGALGLAPADDKIIRVECILGLDPEAQLIASILAKKLAVNASYVLLDIPYGKGAKVTHAEAEKLAKKFSQLAKNFGLKLKIILTDGSQPIGNGIGPVLEARDVIAVLARQEKRPLDLEKKSIRLSALLLELTRKAKPGQGLALAKQLLNSGKAYKKFKEIIEAQGGSLENLDRKLAFAKYKTEIEAKKQGKISAIGNKAISAIARAAGCPADKSAGLYLHKHVNAVVKKGETLLTIYAQTREKLGYAKKLCNNLQPIKIK